MTTYAFPAIAASSSTWELVSNVAIFRSFSGAVQTLDRGGERWRVTLNFLNLTTANKADLKAFLVKLNGQQHRFTMHDQSQIQRGAFGGTPLVVGAGQTGTSINVDGCTPNVTNWIRAGDLFEVDGKLKMAVADASSDGGGNITIEFRPRILTAPPDNDPIVTTDPVGQFILDTDSVSWTNAPGDFSSFAFSAIEDIAA